MSDVTYMVVFRGELVDGADLEQVKAKLESLCKLTRDKVEQLFTLPAVVLKKNLTHEVARGFKHQLENIGVVTEVKAMDEAKVITVGEHSHATGGAATATRDEADSTESRRLQVEFHGQGGEYFKIWIVNILLSILTIGIYSAWAKVRNHRYFYSNTQIGSGTFEYTANPIAILKGRLIAVVFLLAFSMSGQFLPALGVVLQVVFIVALPWLINRSMAFRNRNTVYRNVRFTFEGSYFEALKAFILWPIAGLFTVGILMPYAVFRQKQYLVMNSSYGTSRFESSFGWREIYGIAIRAFLLMILAGIVFGLSSLLGPLAIIGLLPALVIYLIAFAYYSANINNTIYNHSNLLDHGFESTLTTRGLAMVFFTNWLIVVLTLGLGMPWAKVRLAKYRADNLVFLVEGSLDNFIAAEEEQVNSLGEELGEAFDVDIGL